MNLTTELLKEGRSQDIWTKHCGFVNLNLDEFMGIQRRLFTEQIDLLYDSSLGQEILNGGKPQNLEEFRQKIPLTTYEDYAHYLDEKNEDLKLADALPVLP